MRSSRREFRKALTDFQRALQVAPANWSYRKMVERNLARTRKKLAGSGK